MSGKCQGKKVGFNEEATVGDSEKSFIGVTSHEDEVCTTATAHVI